MPCSIDWLQPVATNDSRCPRHESLSCLWQDGVKDGTAVPDRSDGRSRLLSQPGPITHLRKRDAPSVNMRLEELGRRHHTASRGFESGRAHQHSRTY
jgi:hypothetical protein